MKGEFEEQQEGDNSHQHQHQYSVPPSTTIVTSTPQNANATQMFPKFLSLPPHLQQYPLHNLHHQQPQQQPQYNSGSTEITPVTQTPPLKKPKTATPTTSEEGGTIEVSRRSRGRPPGSKNKPKPPIIITRETEPAMSPYILELPSGADIVETLTRFTRRRGVGLCVLTASGAVANVTLKQPLISRAGGTVAFHGRFDILSLSACVMNNTVPFDANSGGCSVSLAGPQGQVVGGKVVGRLVCAGIVYVVAASFNGPSFCRLPLEDNHHQQQLQSNNNVNNEYTVMGNDRVTGGDGQGDSPSPIRSSGGGGEGDSSGGHMGAGMGNSRQYHNQHHGGGSGGGDVIWA